jgi:small-conductance mechanosensitive channel
LERPQLPLSWLAALDFRLFTVGGTEVTLFALLWVLLLSAALIYFARWLRAWTAEQVLGRTHLNAGTRQAVASIVRYVVLAIGFLQILQAVGINLTTFQVLAGALAFGVGFGLQNIFSNFISGLIIMIERPIKIGDRVEIAGVEGEVAQIGARRTTIVTSDRIAVIIPNQRFVTDNVRNMAYLDAPVRLRIPVQVQHGPDPREVERVILESARGKANVLAQPPPTVRLVGMAGNMSFELQVWNRVGVHEKDEMVSALNFAILEGLRAREFKPA